MRNSSFDIRALYTPQFEQFGARLEERGSISVLEFDNEIGWGDAWAIPISDHCFVMEHNVTPRRDMILSEFTPTPYACVTSINQSTLACMPESGIVAKNLTSARGSCPTETVCTFIQGHCGETKSPLKAGSIYHSRSIIFMPGYFRELERTYGTEFRGLFDSFGQMAWGVEASQAMTSALHRLSFRRAKKAAAHMHARSVVETMVADLAASKNACSNAETAASSHRNVRLTREASNAIEYAIDAGQQLHIDELVAMLYVSRSSLCAVFKQETGESVAAYTRRRRTERAADLLETTSLSIAQISDRLGYAHQAAFSQAFTKETGITPSQWRQIH